MAPYRCSISLSNRLCLLGLLWIFICALPARVDGMGFTEKADMARAVKEMFYHGYDNYMAHAFPHDELKSISGSWTDTLAELGNAKHKAGSKYSGVAMSLIDSLSTLALLGNKTEFTKAVLWLESHISWDQDVRVNLFEVNIRLLGGLLSGHALALDPSLDIIANYSGGLLRLATDLGDRMMKAFTADSPLPYAWINLKYGVEHGETREQCTAGIGTLIMELGLLSYYTKDDRYFEAAFDALLKLWSLRSSIDLLGNTVDVATFAWINNNAGIGSGIDSFYEYLVKAYVLFGNSRFLDMFESTYAAVNKYLKTGDWYVEGNMGNGAHTHVQFNSLQAFWPGLQVLVGDLRAAVDTQAKFHGLWKRFDGLPERFVLPANQLHSSERHYPLRPEFVESTYHLYKATGNRSYLEMGKDIYYSLENFTRVKYGYACVRNVETKELDDYMSSYFLAETTKYLYLLFDDDNFAHRTDFIFTTEGHLFPLNSEIHRTYGDSSRFGSRTAQEKVHATSSIPEWRAIAASSPVIENEFMELVEKEARPKETSIPPPAGSPTQVLESEFTVHVGDGNFGVRHVSGEAVDIRNLGTGVVEVVNRNSDGHLVAVVLVDKAVIVYSVGVHSEHCTETLAAMGAFFGPLPGLKTGFTRASPGKPFEIVVVETTEENNEEKKGKVGEASQNGQESLEVSAARVDVRTAKANLESARAELEIVKMDMEDVPPTTALKADETSRDRLELEKHKSRLHLLFANLTQVHAAMLSNEVAEGHLEATTRSIEEGMKRALADLKKVDLLLNETEDVIEVFQSRFELAATRVVLMEGEAEAAEKILETWLRLEPSSFSVKVPEELWGQLVSAVPFNGCEVPSNAAELKGNVAFVQRGQCTFLQKAAVMQAAGAIAVVVGNTVDENNVFLMGSDGTGSTAKIPAAMVTKAGHKYLSQCLEKGPLKLGMWRKKYSLESGVFQLSTENPVMSTPAISLSGNLAKFELETMGGWKVEVEQKGVSYVLKIH